ncbi:hypothetical protein EDD29_8600 [Actinocorallia herbida]|uniref:CU044_5270 family protein n=1 Tax=Actinocorallia herbida TaxID=58109 RepID=A0A3N1DBH6_9ACTN|nr:CU044_5270 family protein [Actinocorallia herbida]ROO90859.1 hypothetical protein EDD29_8600 [Actinocorallia herbida]
MNDLEHLKTALAVPAPDRSVRDAGRHRLQRLIRAEGGRPSGGPRLTWRGLAIGAIGTVAAGAVLATTTLTAPQDPGTGAIAPGDSSVLLPADTVLMAASSKVRQRPEKGGYWRAKTENAPFKYKTAKGYTVQATMRTETWITASPQVKGWRVFDMSGYAPATPADKSAWEADGSPTSWRVEWAPGFCEQVKVKGGKDCHVTVTSEPEHSVEPIKTKNSIGDLGGRPITLDQVRALPTDADGLEAALADRMPGIEKEELRDTIIFEAGIDMIMRLPVTAEVRAAAYEMLAGLPGVESTGVIADPLGRRGPSVATNADGADNVLYQLILDEKTGLPLATQTVEVADGGTSGASVVTEIGWTDEKPGLS